MAANQLPPEAPIALPGCDVRVGWGRCSVDRHGYPGPFDDVIILVGRQGPEQLITR
jgi:hypothetical protein